MYVRFLKGRLDTRFYKEVEALEDEVAKLYVPQNGCVHAHFFGDRETGWYGNASVWESMEAIEALGQTAEMQRLLKLFAPYFVDSPPVTVEIYPFYQPKTGVEGSSNR